MEQDRPLQDLSDKIWRELLMELSRHLTKKNWEDLLHLAVIPEGTAESVTQAFDALQCLEWHGSFDKTRPDALSRELVAIRRRDLLPFVSNYKEKIVVAKKVPVVTKKSSPVNCGRASLGRPKAVNPVLLSPRSFAKGKQKVVQPSTNDEKFASVETEAEAMSSLSISSSNSVDISKREALGVGKSRECHVKSGLCLILNFEHFTSHLIDGRRLLNRLGSSVDRDNLEMTFRWLGFEVETKDDLTEEETRNVLTKYACRDFSKYDAFACAILSHGFDGGLYTREGNCLFIQDLRQIFTGSNNTSLVGKPKLFFIQACRGDKHDSGDIGPDAPVSDSAGSTPIRLPSASDFLFAFAVTPGNVSWRSESKGSWFISTLCQVLQEEAAKETLPTILVHATYELSQKCGWPDGYLVKQGGEQSSSLNRVVHFHPKIEWKNYESLKPSEQEEGTLPEESDSS